MATRIYDCAIIGGGLAGLSLSVLLARAGKKAILFEKETYPFHKVCGEYISNESIPFLESLGVDFKNRHLPRIDQLLLSSPSGISVRRPLDVGGIGLSRYVLDDQLFQLSTAAGVEVHTNTKVQQVKCKNNIFYINADGIEIQAKTAIGAYGKNSNIDVQLQRKYKAPAEKDLFIAVKHHILADYDNTYVEMHNFPGGYCGLSAIEDNKVTMSYISKVANLKKHGSIAAMEKNVLSLNPYLKKYFANAKFIFQKPLTISHLYFQIKQPVSEHIIMLGDAAGNIAPLSGNGMSMALQSSKLAYSAIMAYLNKEVPLETMEQMYTDVYYKTFSERIRIAGTINYSFGNSLLTDCMFLLLKTFPGMIDIMSKKIHGQTF